MLLLSNSIPKSGSTIMFSLQKSFLEAVMGMNCVPEDKKVRDYEIAGGYVLRPSSTGFAKYARKISAEEGSTFILKAHAILNGKIGEAFLESKGFHASLCVRDPLEIYYSARANYQKTGEFQEFADVDSACNMIDTFFRKIFQSSWNKKKEKDVRIVKYETIVQHPEQALMMSLPPEILEIAKERYSGKPTSDLEVVASFTNLDDANRMALSRFNVGKVGTAKDFSSEADYEYIKRRLEEFREILRYA